MAIWINKNKHIMMRISGGLILTAFIVASLNLTAVVDSLLVTATLIASVPIVYHAYQSARMRTFSIELLVTIAVVGALIIGEYVESSVVTFLFLFGSYLEAKTLKKTRASIEQLIDMVPKTATVKKGERTEEVSIDSLEKHDEILVYSGGSIPVDGYIKKGEASVNEASITGESMPVEKQEGDYVYSGTMIDVGYIHLVAEKTGEDSTFQKIIQLVEEAQDQQSKTEKFLNRFSQVYTPLIALLSLIVYLITRDLHLSITFLVIACPGALVIGAPVSNVAGIGNGAKHGVLLKGGDVVDRLSQVDTFVFDKTGTLTRGEPEVTEVVSLTEDDWKEWFKDVASIEQASEHHLGRSIVEYAHQHDLKLTSEVQSVQVTKGKGIAASVYEIEYTIGNRKLLEDIQIHLDARTDQLAQEQEALGKTVIFISQSSQIVGLIMIEDPVREGVKPILEKLKQNGVKQFVMLTGDHERTAQKIANELAIDQVYAELLPEDKLTYIEQLKEDNKGVLMAGDGINDAPALAASDIGLAMGITGTDVAIETADVVLMADRYDHLLHAYRLAKQIVKNRWQNIAIALVTVAFLLVGVLYGVIHLASGMFVHEASVIIVIMNAMRLRQFKKK
ncbi:Cd2+/Zn2+-exporting ATPase [Pelagirhabdus alkalitolerans]|uniref:Cd(2+)-exporting ATPase n=1 Tax=Pelagirhabdus alkalitolerans TaxID=1612202 RepID=A0A1G6GM32_9BACI|nr:Cd2+/Zn2+-exporting ATPase [Pelagirhabdus alkalitolerans]